MDNSEHSIGSEVPLYKLKQVVFAKYLFRNRYSSVVDPGGGAPEMRAPLGQFK